MTSDKREWSIVSNPDEQLKRIENQVKILLERQRLSRFDNLMFLFYPLVIFGIGLSLTLSLQYEMMKSIMIWGVSMAQILDTFRLVYVLGPALIFAWFCWGYAADDLVIRLESLELLGLMLLVLPFSIISLFLTHHFVLPASFTTIFPILLLSIPPYFVLMYLAGEAGQRLAGWVASWFERNIPITVEASHGRLRKFHARSRHLPVKVVWSASSLMYFMILAIAAWRGELIGETGHNALYLAAFFAVTETVMLWRL